MNRRQTLVVLGAAGAGAAAALAYAATRSAGPVPLSEFTELREGPLQEHLVTEEELGLVGAVHPHRYPVKVASGISSVVRRGFGPLYTLPDPQMAALPAEAD